MLLRVLHAIWMTAMGLAGGYVTQYLVMAKELGAFSETVGLVLAGLAGLVGLIGSVFFYDDIGNI